MITDTIAVLESALAERERQIDALQKQIDYLRGNMAAVLERLNRLENENA